MDWKLIASVFTTVFLAELGDKTQLATMTFAANGQVSKWSVFLGSAAALVLSSAIGVMAGQAVTAVISPKMLQWIAGLGFVAIGIWTLIKA
jgi:putative Ca2+/H+ antiporter (TMEM165/GDT1 family)